jgi:CRISPR-associated protein Cmr2
MAWSYGGVSKTLGIPDESSSQLPDYENLVRFPNLSSIAAARFAATYPQEVDRYWRKLAPRVNQQLIQKAPEAIRKKERRIFFKKAKRPFQIQASDRCLTKLPNHGKGYNGVMFSSKWLAEDMNLPASDRPTLRQIVDQTHRDCGFSRPPAKVE